MNSRLLLPERIYDRNGKIVRTSRNLAGVRRHATKVLASKICVNRIKHDEGMLEVLFENGDTYKTKFGSFDVLMPWLRNWRSVFGAHLYVNGVDCGKMYHDNHIFRKESHAKDSVRVR